MLGLIPARGGSRGVPRKNIVPLAGRPLLAHTCDAALASHHLTRVVLSTDDDEVAEVGRACGVEVPFRRPADLARADTPTLPVAQHAVRWLIEHQDWHPDIVVLLQPTSPLRGGRHIDEVLECMAQGEADTVVSVVPVPHRFSPYSILRLQNGVLRDFWDGPVAFDRFRRQDAPPLYARNGPAILATRTRVLLESESFYGQRVLPYVMSEEESIDVDTWFDLQLAEWLSGRRGEPGG